MPGQVFVTQTPQGIDYALGAVLSSSVIAAGGSNISPPPGYANSQSGTVGQTLFDIQEVIEKAWRRCKLTPDKLTPEWIHSMRRSLFVLLSDLANEGIPLWKVARVILPCNPGQAFVPCPVGTVDVLNLNYRNVTIWTGASASSAGGVAASANDMDPTTSCIQNAPNGNISIDFGANGAQPVTTLGVMSLTNQYYQLALEASADNVTWQPIVTLPQLLFPDNQFVWLDVDGSPAYRYWRVRETGGNTLQVRELSFATTPAAVPMGFENRDTFAALPNRTFQAANPAIYYYDKQRDQPVIQIWPVPSGPFIQLEAWLHLHLQDVGLQTQFLDAPQRWNDAITWKLAADLAGEHLEVSSEREGIVMKRSQMATAKAWSHESDRSPIRISSDISAYTT